MKNKSIYLLDTNFILRYLLKDVFEQFDVANKLVTEIEKGELKAKIIDGVFCEVVYVLGKVYNVPRKEISDILTELLTYKGFISTEPLKLALLKFSKNNIDIVDCLLCAYSELSSNEYVITFDKKLNNLIKKQN